jgi:hypothetical protein
MVKKMSQGNLLNTALIKTTGLRILNNEMIHSIIAQTFPQSIADNFDLKSRTN